MSVLWVPEKLLRRWFGRHKKSWQFVWMLPEKAAFSSNVSRKYSYSALIRPVFALDTFPRLAFNVWKEKKMAQDSGSGEVLHDLSLNPEEGESLQHGSWVHVQTKLPPVSLHNNEPKHISYISCKQYPELSVSWVAVQCICPDYCRPKNNITDTFIGFLLVWKIYLLYFFFLYFDGEIFFLVTLTLHSFSDGEWWWLWWLCCVCVREKSLKHY